MIPVPQFTSLMVKLPNLMEPEQFHLQNRVNSTSAWGGSKD